MPRDTCLSNLEEMVFRIITYSCIWGLGITRDCHTAYLGGGSGIGRAVIDLLKS